MSLSKYDKGQGHKVVNTVVIWKNLNQGIWLRYKAEWGYLYNSEHLLGLTLKSFLLATVQGRIEHHREGLLQLNSSLLTILVLQEQFTGVNMAS